MTADTPAALSPTTEALSAIADDLMLLARLCDREADAELIELLRAAPVPDWFSLTLSGKDVEEACRLLDIAFTTMAEPVSARNLDELAAEYAGIFLTHHYRAAPTESVWRDEEGLERQHSMFAVREWYERYRVTVPDWRRRSDDHLVHELEFLAFLLRGADNKDVLEDAARFMRKHLLVWVKSFASTVVHRCRLPFYAGVMLVTAIYLDTLAQRLGETLGVDMTPDPLNLFAASPAELAGKAGLIKKTCADTDVKPYMPGAAPSW